MDTKVEVTRDSRVRRRWRLLSVIASVTAALAMWVIVEHGLGLDLRAPGFGEYGRTSDIGPGQVAFVSGLAAVAGWATMALLELLTSRARRAWIVIAPLALVVSLGGPLSGAGISAANRMGLIGLHLVAGAVLIPWLYRTSPQTVASPRERRRLQTEHAHTSKEAA
jgi:Family of unknown function (DUF6069)